MQTPPSVSVIMSVYGEPLEWLRQSIESILHQTYNDFEFIIICDNPNYKDGINLLKEYKLKDGRIILLFNETNIGLTRSLNKCLLIARGRYIARMDADDISKPNRLELQVRCLDSNDELDIVQSYFTLFNNAGKNQKIEYPVENKSIIDCLMATNCICHPVVMFRSSIVKDKGLKYNEEYRSSQDYELWLNAAYAGCRFYTIPEHLLEYRLSSQQITSVRREEQLKNHYRIKRSFLSRLCSENGIEFPPEFNRRYINSFAFLSPNEKNNSLIERSFRFHLYYTMTSSAKKFFFLLFDAYRFKFTYRQICILFISLFYKGRWTDYDMKPYIK